MRTSPRILPIRSPRKPARLGCQRHSAADLVRIRAGFVLRQLALADASRPAWLNAPLFSRRHQSLTAIERHAA
ncbi:MAG: hypothetical protein JF599_11490 [Verrucomicrobia bacterium]|nr:hypothetical protein [Verrucomicrobiota bacterium]